ncbi:lysozyme P [Drosophila busckii]|uniref:lysozyme P n=1 Tax=Drosophila busckii TaxID=30019 RepID=UPI00083F26DB|nr:lysozyme P [Drosophila busckii]
MPKVLLLLLIFLKLSTLDARQIGKCSLARKLYRYGVPYNELADWLCLVEGESSFDTKAVNPSNADGSVDWGLFQINDRYWCKPSDGRPSSDSCRLPCRLLLSDDIRYSIACAKYIRKEQGFSAWVAWNNRCQGEKPSVRHCFKHSNRYIG